MTRSARQVRFRKTAERIWRQARSAEFDVDVAGVRVPFQVEGEILDGGGSVPLGPEDDLLAGARWHAAGYAVAPLLPNASDYSAMVSRITDKVGRAIDAAGMRVPDGFRLKDYHRVVGGSQDMHRKVLGLLEGGEPPIDLEPIGRRISAICGRRLSEGHPDSDYVRCRIRIVRPLSLDHIPPHRDSYHDEYRRLVNLYIPIAGSDARSSLPLIPGSHLWPESMLRKTAPGARINNTVFSTSAVTHARGRLKMIRPDPGGNEVLVFSPHIIHGAGANLNRNRTRISLEVRLCAA